jgi:hypothetical protein
MKPVYIILIATILMSASSYVGSHEDITTVSELFGNVQHLFGLLGVIASVTWAFFAKSPIEAGNSYISKVTGNGKTPLPPDVN